MLLMCSCEFGIETDLFSFFLFLFFVSLGSSDYVRVWSYSDTLKASSDNWVADELLALSSPPSSRTPGSLLVYNTHCHSLLRYRRRSSRLLHLTSKVLRLNTYALCDMPLDFMVQVICNQSTFFDYALFIPKLPLFFSFHYRKATFLVSVFSFSEPAICNVTRPAAGVFLIATSQRSR